MEKHIDTEPQLSEEQLQKITGGNGLADLALAARHQNFAKTYTDLSRAATDSGHTSEATRYLNLAKQEAQKAHNLLQGVARGGSK